MSTTIDIKLNDDIIVTDGLEAFKESLAALNMFPGITPRTRPIAVTR